MATGRIGTTPVLQVRWSKAPTNGTTSLSGLDDNSVSLVYSVGYEAVYRNGVLLSRGNDYTATNGTTVTLIDATITGDIIEIFANQTIPLADTYSQTVANGKFINNTLTTTTGDIIYASAANTPARLGIGSSAQVLAVSGGIPAWTTPSSGALTLLKKETFSAVSSVSIGSNASPLFSSTYDNYYINFIGTTSSNTGLFFRLRANTTDASTNYSRQQIEAVNATTYISSATSQTSGYFGSVRTDRSANDLYLYSPFLATQTIGFVNANGGAGDAIAIQNSRHTDTTSYNGITVLPGGGTITGTLLIYGYGQ